MPTHHDPVATQLSCYIDFINQGPTWITQKWGDATCVGWKGTPPQLDAAYCTFVNYDARPKDYWGISPNPPQLSVAWEGLHYIYMTEDRLLDTLSLMFEVLVGRELGRWVQVGEFVDDRDWVVDSEQAERLGRQAAAAFIRDHIKTESFVPDPIQPLIAEHSLGRPDRLEYDKVENLADQAISA